MSADSGVLDRTFRALADPGRRRMLERLSRGPASVSELGQPLQMTLAAVVQHVQVLEASGLVETHKAGRVRTCRLVTGATTPAEDWLVRHRAEWEQRLDLLGAVLDRDATAEGPGAPG